MSEPQPTRRALLGGSLALTLAACTPPGEPEPPGPDVVLVGRAVAGEQALLAYYHAVLRRHPGMEAQVGPILSDHRAHLRALRAQVSPTPAVLPTSPSPPAAPTSAGPGRARSPSPPRVPAGEAEAAAALAERECSAAAARVEDLSGAPPFLAQLLASIGASEAAHAGLLAGFE